MIITALFVAASVYVRPHCEAEKYSEIDKCAARDLVQAETVLAAEFDRAVTVLRSREGLKGTQAGSKAHRIMVSEHKAWFAWRDAHCDSIAYAIEGTAAEKMVRLDCKTAMTVARTRDLQEVGKDR